MAARRARCFVALDFETATYARDSACEIGLVRVAGGKIVARQSWFIRPPTREFVFSWLHGITWNDVKDAPDFAGLLPRIMALLEGADFVAAHNASFDRGVFFRTCERYGLEKPPHPYVCTVEVARDLWNIRPTKLPDVCAHLGIALKRHHRAENDALACARIVQHATDELGEDGFAARYL